MSSVIDNNDKYKNGKIYKIVDRINGNIYIGSTIQPLNRRLLQHEYDYKLKQKGEINYSVTSFDIIENQNFYIELIENYPCNNRYELELRERFHIDNNICVNKNIPHRTTEERKQHKQQYLLENKAEIKKRDLEYYNKNKAKINEKRKFKILCEICNSYCRKRDIARHKKTQKHINNMNNINN